MHVRHIRIGASPIAGDRSRLTAEVAYEDHAVGPEEYWFDVPARYETQLSCTGSPWLALLVPLAVSLGETLRVDAPVDAMLSNNIQEVMAIWSCWYPHLRPVAIEADTEEVSLAPNRRTASLFSGGVDAWFTLLRHTVKAIEPRVDDCITVWGLDIPLANDAGFDRMRRASQEAGAAYGTEVIDLATNMRDTRWWRDADWGFVSHGCALASFGLALEGRLKNLLVPSSHRYSDPMPWGSHPLTDPLLSTSSFRVIHDGAAFRRVDKTRLLVDHGTALNSLQVCWKSDSYDNCGRCSKCFRTMATLTLLGALSRCPRFPTSALEPKALRKMVPLTESDRSFHRELRQLAVEVQRWDFVRAIDRGMVWGRAIEMAKHLAGHATSDRMIGRVHRHVRHLAHLILAHLLIES